MISKNDLITEIFNLVTPDKYGIFLESILEQLPCSHLNKILAKLVNPKRWEKRR